MIGDIRRTIRRLDPIVPHLRTQISALTITSLLSGLAEAAVLVLIAKVGAAVATGSPTLDVVGSLRIQRSTAIVLVAIGVFGKTVMILLANTVHARFTTAVLVRGRAAVIDGQLHRSWEEAAGTRLGTTQEMLSTATTRVANWAQSLAGAVVALTNLSALTTFAVLVNPIAFGATAGACSLIVLLRPLATRTRRWSNEFAQANTELGTITTDRSGAALEIRTYDVADRVAAELKAASTRTAHALFKTRLLTGMGPHLFQGMALLILTGALAVISTFAQDSAVEFGAVALLMLRAMSYGQQIAGSVQGLAESAPYVEQVLNAAPSTKGAPPDGVSLPIGPHGIRFERVTYAYPGSTPALCDVTFEAYPGEILGVVGPSGAGKSTLVQLLLGLRTPDSGSIMVGGTSIHQVDRHQWAQHVALVPQEPSLIASSLFENIAFYRSVSAADVERASRQALLHGEVTSWAAGYDTIIGERGRQVSGGQRQRIAIARALVGNPSLLVLDEPTSALDGRAEEGIRNVLASLGKKITVILVAHHSSTLSLCDRLLVLDNGHRMAFGPRNEVGFTSASLDQSTTEG